MRLSICPLYENAGRLETRTLPCARRQTHKEYSGLGLAGKGWNEADGRPFYCYVTLLRINLHVRTVRLPDTRAAESHLVEHIVAWFVMFYAFSPPIKDF